MSQTRSIKEENQPLEKENKKKKRLIHSFIRRRLSFTRSIKTNFIRTKKKGVQVKPCYIASRITEKHTYKIRTNQAGTLRR